MFGGITFDGLSTGTNSGTTAYTLGTSSNQIQLAGATGSAASGTATVQATATSTASQTINAGIELWSNSNFDNNMTGGQTLNFNGNLSGAGTLNIDGVGYHDPVGNRELCRYDHHRQQPGLGSASRECRFGIEHRPGDHRNRWERHHCTIGTDRKSHTTKCDRFPWPK